MKQKNYFFIGILVLILAIAIIGIYLTQKSPVEIQKDISYGISVSANNEEIFSIYIYPQLTEKDAIDRYNFWLKDAQTGYGYGVTESLGVGTFSYFGTGSEKEMAPNSIIGFVECNKFIRFYTHEKTITSEKMVEIAKVIEKNLGKDKCRVLNMEELITEQDLMNLGFTNTKISIGPLH